MKITFLITISDEIEVEALFNILINFKYSKEDVDKEILVIYDENTIIPEIIALLEKYNKYLTIYLQKLENNFSQFRNFGLSKATGDYIIVFDGDEIADPDTIELWINEIFKNPDCDGFFVPRLLIHWFKYKRDWPSFRNAIFKNKDYIRYDGNIHECIIGAKFTIYLPAENKYAIIECKTIAHAAKREICYNKILNSQNL